MAQPNSSQTSPGAAAGGSDTRDTSFGGATGTGRAHRDDSLVGRVRERATATLESQKDRATDGLGSVAQAVRNTEEQLRSQRHDSIANYVSQVADQIDRFSRQLHDRHVEDLLSDAQRFARRHPAAFAGSAFVLGVVAARFLKSSGGANGDSEDRYPASDYARSRYGSASGSTATSPAGPIGGSTYGSTGSGTYGSTGSTGESGTAGTGAGPATSSASTAGRGGGIAEPKGPSSPSGTSASRGRRPGSETERS